MSFLKYPDPMNSPDIQVFHNAAFDNGDLDESAPIKPTFADRLDLEFGKENQTPLSGKSLLSAKSLIPIKPLDPNGASANSTGKPLKLLFKQGLISVSPDESKIDTEIEEIEKELSRLSSRLETLRLEKEDTNSKTRGIEQKQGLDNSTGTRFRRRGVSLGPAEINQGIRSLQKEKVDNKSVQSNRRKSWVMKPPEIGHEKVMARRRMSLGPAEINGGLRFQQPGKTEKTPIPLSEIRRKSLKLQEADVAKVNTQRGGRNFSLSPKSILSVSKSQAFTTVDSKKSVIKDNGAQSNVQAKKTVIEGASAKPIRPGRVVPSRYNQIPGQSIVSQRPIDQRKRSLPEDEKEDCKSSDKKPSYTECGSNQGGETRVKKRWDIPRDVMMQKPLMDSPQSVPKTLIPLPKISTIRCAKHSPRDSGAAKRVAELVGRKSYFDTKEASVCQVLSFEEMQLE